jgi:serine/threonine-protein kinase
MKNVILGSIFVAAVLVGAPSCSGSTDANAPLAASGGSASSSSSSGGAGGSAGTGSHNKEIFEAPNAWNTPVESDPPSPTSQAVIDALLAAGGFGFGKFQIDFSITVLHADAATPKLDFTPTGDFYTPDCDHVPFPVPKGGAVEGEAGYTCTNDGDCHLLVVHSDEHKLYEMWRANLVGNNFEGGCASVWDLTKSYPGSLRGEQCTSADAGGFPIAAMVFTADEVAAGSIDHAIRFILPNDRIRHGSYAHPATHTTGACKGGPDAPPYGVRLRLRNYFPLASLPSDGARVIAKGLQKYGMLLADGGNIALTAADDRFTAHTWSEVGVDSHSLLAITPKDFEVVGLDATVPYDGNCVRNP